MYFYHSDRVRGIRLLDKEGESEDMRTADCSFYYHPCTYRLDELYTVPYNRFREVRAVAPPSEEIDGLILYYEQMEQD